MVFYRPSDAGGDHRISDANPIEYNHMLNISNIQNLFNMLHVGSIHNLIPGGFDPRTSWTQSVLLPANLHTLPAPTPNPHHPHPPTPPLHPTPGRCHPHRTTPQGGRQILPYPKAVGPPTPQPCKVGPPLPTPGGGLPTPGDGHSGSMGGLIKSNK